MALVSLKPDRAQKTLWYAQTVLIALLMGLLFFLPLTASKTVNVGAALVFFLTVLFIIALLILIWIPFYYRSLSYDLDQQEIRVAKGVFWKQRLTVPYTKITNVDVSQGPVERLFGLSRIQVQTAGYGGSSGSKAEQTLVGMRQPEEIRKGIMRRIEASQRAEEGAISESPDPVVTSDSSLLQAIHEELKSIRSLLEQRS